MAVVTTIEKMRIRVPKSTTHRYSKWKMRFSSKMIGKKPLMLRLTVSQVKASNLTLLTRIIIMLMPILRVKNLLIKNQKKILYVNL